MFIILLLAAFTPKHGAPSERLRLTSSEPHATVNPSDTTPPARGQETIVPVVATALLLAILVLAGIFGVLLSSNSGGNAVGSRPNRPAAKADPPTRIVSTFYDAISRKDFRSAWNLLSPSFQHEGSFENFRRGYATTQSVSVSVTEVPGAPQKVRTSLDATDLINGRTVHSHFEGWWVLTQAPDGRWLLDDGHLTKTQLEQKESPSAEGPAAATQDVENAWPAWGFRDKQDLATYVRAWAILGVDRAESDAQASAEIKHAVDLEGRTVAVLHRERYDFQIWAGVQAHHPDFTSWPFCEVSSRDATYWMVCNNLGHGYGVRYIRYRDVDYNS
jgi:hypothetical protein